MITDETKKARIKLVQEYFLKISVMKNVSDTGSV
jgi:hypothetical protein